MSKWSSITRLVAAGHEDEVLDARRPRLIDDVLDHGAVDDGQHLLRHGLGGRQEAGAETGDGEDGFADALHREIVGVERISGRSSRQGLSLH